MTSFATPAELALFIGNPSIDQSPTGRAQMLLNDATGLIRRYVDQRISLESYSEEHNPSGTRRLFLHQLPVVSVESVTVDGALLAEAAYEFESYGVLRRVDGDLWLADPGGIVVAYTAGFDLASDEMDDVKAICKQVAARALTLNAAGEATALEGVQESVGFAPGIFLDPSERRILDRLRQVLFA